MKEKEKEALTPVQERVAELQEEKNQGILKSGELVGAIKARRFHEELLRYFRISTQIRALEEGAHEVYGMDAKTFCKKVLGIPYTTLNEQRALLKDVKLEVVAAFKAMGCSDYEIGLLKTSEDEEVKALMSKGTLVVGSQEISITPDNMPRIVRHVERIVQKSNNLEEENQRLKKECDSKYDTQKQYKEKLAVKEKEISQLKAQLDDQGIPEGDKEALKKIETLKIQLRGIIRIIESANLKGHNEEVKEDLLLLAQYAHDRGELCLGRVLELTKGPAHTPDREYAEEEYKKVWEED
jgi:hypothetical protein